MTFDPSQVITTFGPGAIVDLQTLSVIVAGIDSWPIEEESVIHEPRLERALRVKRFFPPNQARAVFLPSEERFQRYLFPRHQVCPVCRTLSAVGDGLVEYDAKWQEVACKAPGCKGRGSTGQRRCRRRLSSPVPADTSTSFRGGSTCTAAQRLVGNEWNSFRSAKTGTVADILIKCECDQDAVRE